MNPLDCYRMYMAIRLHFISKSYDYFKYNGKVKTSNESFYKRRDKYRFDHLCRQYKEKDIMHFFVANFSNGDKYGGLHTEESDQIYMDWRKRTQRLRYQFKSDVSKLLGASGLDQLFVVDDGQNPTILTMYYHGDISLESFVIMNQILNFFPQFDRQIEDDIMWPETRNLCDKYVSFLNVDVKKFRDILKKELDI